MEMSKYNIEKFNGKNDFKLWQASIYAILVQEDTHLALTPDKFPAKMDVAQKDKIVAKAHSTLILSLADEALGNVMDLPSAVDLCKSLEEIYMTKLLSSRSLLLKRLYTFKMRFGTNLQDHLNDFNKILMDLNCLGEKPTDEHQAIILLCSLAKAYEEFVDSMLCSKEKLTLQEVVNALNLKEMRMTDAEEERVPKVFKCFACHNQGHLKRDCPQRRGKAAADR